jgi:hypothetical protein
MSKPKYTVLLVLAIAALIAIAVMGTAAAKSTPPVQDKLALGEVEVKQLLLLMDTDQNGKISRAEYMRFMEAEFDRLDTDKSGELDAKELTQSKVRVSHFRSR